MVTQISNKNQEEIYFLPWKIGYQLVNEDKNVAEARERKLRKPMLQSQNGSEDLAGRSWCKIFPATEFVFNKHQRNQMSL